MKMNLMKMDLIKKKKKKGFTLIELIVVIAIIGILAAVAVPRLSGFQDKARRTQVVTDANQITTAIESLLTESANGSIGGVATATAVATLRTQATPDPVVILSGIADPATGSTKTLTYGTNGTFTLVEVINSITYTATRAVAQPAIVTP